MIVASRREDALACPPGWRASRFCGMMRARRTEDRMSETELTPAQMRQRLARFSELKPYKETLNEAHGIPPDAMQTMSSERVFPIMAPEGWTGRNKIAPVKGAPGLTITLAEC